MTSDEKVISRLQELIERGREIERTKKNPPPNCIGFDATVDSQAGSQWLTSSKNILGRAFGKDSEHYLLFQGCFANGITYSPVHRGIGVLEAAKEDLEHGYLRDLRILVAAEVFSDFLEQASVLLEAGYIGPAAVVAGTVLEDNLRKLCSANDIELPDKPKLDYMNAQLAKADVYNKLTQKRLTAIADIRNSAAHGKWDDFSADDVADMIKWIVAFTEKQLG
jgi:hypothetical protein